MGRLISIALLVTLITGCASRGVRDVPIAQSPSTVQAPTGVAFTSTPPPTPVPATPIPAIPTKCPPATAVTRNPLDRYASPSPSAAVPFTSDPDPTTGVRYTGTIAFSWAASGAGLAFFAITITNSSTELIPVALNDFAVMASTDSTKVIPIAYINRGVPRYLGVAPGETEQIEVYATGGGAWLEPGSVVWQIAGHLGTVTAPLYTPPLLPTATPLPTRPPC
jgi:hypothetical protein